MLKELDDYDWGEAFGYAGEPGHYGAGEGGTNVDPVPGAQCKPLGFTREDVAIILAMEAGENDGANWVCAGQLRDGRWFFLSAGCDYTGWDCRSGGNATVADTKEDLIRLGMGREDRLRLGLESAA